MKHIFQKRFYSIKRLFLREIPFTNSAKHYSYLGSWESPKGYDSEITVYNSATNKKEKLILKSKDIASWYICGPTVYDESHIGHACCYVKFDILRRIMENIFKINVVTLMGITDIDDKIIKKSQEGEKSASNIAKQYEFDFFKDMEAMRVKQPTTVSRVTENIHLIIDFCSQLIEKDYAYVTEEGNVYFIVSKSASANILNEMHEDNSDSIDSLKRDKRDFALWKKAKLGEPFWLSPWGKGRPGWHIECSTIASNVFGHQLDIHSGGYDLLFPHHTNEKSQSEAFHDCSQWVNYWLHSGLLLLGGEEKMSKSIKNTISIKDYLKTNTVNDFRILCLQSLYRKNITYCSETTDNACSLHEKLHNFVNECETYIAGDSRISLEMEKLLSSKLEVTKEKVIAFLSDDFNTSQALLCLNDLVDEVNRAFQLSEVPSSSTVQSVKTVAACLNYINVTLETFGVEIVCKKKLEREFIDFVDKVILFRNIVRLFALCHSKSENTSPTKYMEEAFLEVDKHSCVLRLQDSCKITEGIKYAAHMMFKQTLAFVSSSSENITSHGAENIKTERKKRAFLLTLCDNLRSSLQMHGIAIKDQKYSSTWFPLKNFKM